MSPPFREAEWGADRGGYGGGGGPYNIAKSQSQSQDIALSADLEVGRRIVKREIEEPRIQSRNFVV